MTPWVYLSSFGPGYRPAGGDVGGLETRARRSAAGPGRCRPVRRGRNRPARERVSGRRTSPSARRARAGRRRPRCARRCRWGCRRPPPGSPHRRRRRTPRRRPAAADPSRRSRRRRRSPDRLLPERFRRSGRRRGRNAANAFAWVRSGLSSTAAAAAPRRRRNVAAHSASPPLSPEPTTAQTRRPDTPPVRRPEFAGDRGGQPVGGAAHQRTVGQRCQQRCFGLPDRVSGCSSAASVPIPLDLPARQ